MVRASLALTLAFLGLSTAASSSHAADHQFPYTATVATAEAEVRCGPGQQFYVTGIAKQNDVLTVHRHDRGGWYMIAPPSGSFSWIEASFVERKGGNRGVVTVDPDAGPSARAVVRIGSQVSDDHGFFGRQLSNGDEVTILGEKKLHTPQGTVAMLKIAPPPQEFRWVKGESLVPQSQQVQLTMTADPYQIPPQQKKRLAQEGKAPVVAAVTEPPREQLQFAGPIAAPLAGPVLKAPRPQQIASANPDAVILERAEPAHAPTPMPGAPAGPVAGSVAQLTPRFDFSRLDAVDQEYKNIVQRDPREWKLDDVVQRYRELAEDAPESFRPLIQSRIEVAQQRQIIGNRYQSFVRVSAETAERDAALLAQQRSPVETAMFEAGGEQGMMAETPTNDFQQGMTTQGFEMPMNTPATGNAPLMFPQPNGPMQQLPQMAGRNLPGQNFPAQPMTGPTPAGQPHQMAGIPTQYPMHHPMAAPQMSAPHMAMPHQLEGPHQGSPMGMPAPGAGEHPAPELIGAGVLQRMQGPASFPGFALIAPDGRLLAYVTPQPGVQAEEWVGKPVGLVGERDHDPALGRDHIRAKRMVAIQLTP